MNLTVTCSPFVVKPPYKNEREPRSRPLVAIAFSLPLARSLNSKQEGEVSHEYSYFKIVGGCVAKLTVRLRNSMGKFCNT